MHTWENMAFIPPTAVRQSGHRKALEIPDMKLLFKVNPEADSYLVQRDIQVVAKSIMFGGFADGLCVSGASAGSERMIPS